MANKRKMTTKNNNMGLCIALGAGLGIIFGEFTDNVGLGLILGAVAGMIISLSKKPNS
ncbi:hypothetical protein [Pseudoalteromonas luteoviolacea]|uniref:Glycine zipper family protein n=1 Tax=Pseudoalteromonas luteoviolacea H33 TaxID=1365251 RepID=A0A167AWQ0_9GAMM|nr:hypothetical protein [Pseudoalteromonas luteoviolacea]KZN45892.1 hypothetical protein N476_24800 [Pseudoalteromonas luteoviolacea H33]KZN76902.1 hypothetical protein N477_14090 [Pseudoalteromonas luteoviolacea H33-S]